ncbi:hypothetical protein MBRA1_002459 [Malassezia brasiliensis]|uniref:tRNA-splicing endonuclease subunit Sen15 domain-containing protein n=1 Tax=Malassezia brasiliensis TaxID=1821822 RepID=A0AAF0IQ84_9BASI|nr:hypothetical protein MBRA1_002459 [Malassezia brasiliensis]
MSSAARPQAIHHAAHSAVDPMAQAYPAQAAALFQTYVDLRYAASWRDLRVIEIVRDASGDARAFGARGWALICGTAPQTTQPQAVLPMSIEQTFDTAMFSSVFAQLPNDVAASHLLLAMMSSDSTVVYYKLSQGLVKPVN